MKTNDPILSLVAAMERAKTSGLSDDEQRLKTNSFILFNKLYKITDEAHASNPEDFEIGDKVRTRDILWALGAILAFYIGTSTPDAVAGLITLGQVNGQILEILRDTED